jgi:anti-anti-sigma factor
MHLEITVEHDPPYHVIALKGRLDNLTASDFADSIKSDIAAGARRILIDGSGLKYASSAGIAELLSAGKTLAASGGSLAFAALTKPVRSVFEIVGFPKLFKIHESREAAHADTQDEAGAR